MGKFSAFQKAVGVLAGCFGVAWSMTAFADVDVEAAKALARQNNCFKCHAVEKEKDGPAWKKVAEKYKGKENAETRLIEHITSGEKAKGQSVIDQPLLQRKTLAVRTSICAES